MKIFFENNINYDKERKVIFDNLKKIDLKTNPYRMNNSERRIFCFLGRTRVGKTTVCETLSNSMNVAREQKLFSETTTINAQSITTQNNGKTHIFTVVDTPGLSEIKEDGVETNKDENTLKEIWKFFKERHPEVHHFFFVFNLNSGIHVEDVNSIVKIKKLFW